MSTASEPSLGNKWQQELPPITAKPLAPVTGADLKKAKEKWRKAADEHKSASEECTKWMNKTRETAKAMIEAEAEYSRAALGYRGSW